MGRCLCLHCFHLDILNSGEKSSQSGNGDFIQHCPTNGDPNYDMRKVKQTTGIPRSMLMVNSQGSYALPSIRDYIISKCVCVCGATNILVDELLPNKTLRDTINHTVLAIAVLKMLEALFKFKVIETIMMSLELLLSIIVPMFPFFVYEFEFSDMESARCPQPKIPSPTSSAASMGRFRPLLSAPPSNNKEIHFYVLVK
ncbi:hypothetical protein VNO80_21077 [Phaseolus coccineus]|uniref:Uncharacterized protein n=1 Tax=Phaseolus coccineus TaxID=3886 RepID=A0AAN9M367_PHACN